MKNLMRSEEALLFLACIALFSLLPYSWWWFPALILLPDIGMLGYLAGPKAGAWAYNLFHHRGLALVVGVAGLLAGSPIVELAGLILFAHVAMDRFFGYGLKYERGFAFTHLGEVGRKPESHG